MAIVVEFDYLFLISVINNAKASQTDLSSIWIAFCKIFPELGERFLYGSKKLPTDSLNPCP